MTIVIIMIRDITAITTVITTITIGSTTTIAIRRAIGIGVITMLSMSTRAAIGTENGSRTFAKDLFLPLTCVEPSGLSRTIYLFALGPRPQGIATS